MDRLTTRIRKKAANIVHFLFSCGKGKIKFGIIKSLRVWKLWWIRNVVRIVCETGFDIKLETHTLYVFFFLISNTFENRTYNATPLKTERQHWMFIFYEDSRWSKYILNSETATSVFNVLVSTSLMLQTSEVKSIVGNRLLNLLEET